MGACTICHPVCGNKCFYIQRSAHRSERQEECRGHDPKSLEVSSDFLFLCGAELCIFLGDLVLSQAHRGGQERMR